MLQLELKIVLLLRSLQYESNELGSERDLVRDLEKVKDALPNAAQQREQATATLESFRAGHAALDKADKLLERCAVTHTHAPSASFRNVQDRRTSPAHVTPFVAGDLNSS